MSLTVFGINLRAFLTVTNLGTAKNSWRTFTHLTHRGQILGGLRYLPQHFFVLDFLYFSTFGIVMKPFLRVSPGPGDGLEK